MGRCLVKSYEISDKLISKVYLQSDTFDDDRSEPSSRWRCFHAAWSVLSLMPKQAP